MTVWLDRFVNVVGPLLMYVELVGVGELNSWASQDVPPLVETCTVRGPSVPVPYLATSKDSSTSV